MGALLEAYRAGIELGEKEAAAEVKALMPIPLVRVLAPHCDKATADGLRGAIRELGV